MVVISRARHNIFKTPASSAIFSTYHRFGGRQVARISINNMAKNSISGRINVISIVNKTKHAPSVTIRRDNQY